jgi:transposase
MGTVRRVVLGSRSRKSVRIAEGERVFVGVDVHKKAYHVGLWSDGRGLVTTWVQPARACLLVEALCPIRPCVVRIVYEAGPTGYGLVRTLRAGGFCADVIAASKIPSAHGQDAKSDRLDCRKLAEFAAKDLLTPARVPTEEEEADRQVLRLREQMRDKLRKVKSQIKSFLLMHGIPEPDGLRHWARYGVEELHEIELSLELRFCLDVLLGELEHAEAQVRRVTEKVEELAEAERHREDVELLRTVDGVGLVTAMTYKTELLAPERFDDGRQVARITGLAPKVARSGSTMKRGRIMKSGNGRLRTVLVEAAWRWVAADPCAHDRYRRLLANTGEATKAIVGVARHLGIVLWRMLVNKEPYRAPA